MAVSDAEWLRKQRLVECIEHANYVQLPPGVRVETANDSRSLAHRMAVYAVDRLVGDGLLALGQENDDGHCDGGENDGLG